MSQPTTIPDTHIRNLEREPWDQMRIEATRRRIPIGALVSQALQLWLKAQGIK